MYFKIIQFTFMNLLFQHVKPRNVVNEIPPFQCKR